MAHLCRRSLAGEGNLLCVPELCTDGDETFVSLLQPRIFHNTGDVWAWRQILHVGEHGFTYTITICVCSCYYCSRIHCVGAPVHHANIYNALAFNINVVPCRYHSNSRALCFSGFGVLAGVTPNTISHYYVPNKHTHTWDPMLMLVFSGGESFLVLIFYCLVPTIRIQRIICIIIETLGCAIRTLFSSAPNDRLCATPNNAVDEKIIHSNVYLSHWID